MNTRLVCQLALRALLALSPGAFAQTASSSPQCQTLHTYVSVLKPDGHAFTSLTAADFGAEAGGKRAQVTAATLHVPDHRVLVLLDHSGSMQGPKWAVAIGLTRDLIALLPPKVPIEIEWFDDGLHQLVPLTRDHRYADALLNTFLRAGPAPRSRTHLFNAIMEALKTLPTHHPGDVIYALTDGEDNDTFVKTTDIAAELMRSSTRLFAALLQYSEPNEMNEYLRGAQALERIAQETGGDYFLGREPVGEVDEEVLQPARKANFALFESMMGDYSLTLVSPMALAKEGRLRLHVHAPKPGEKMKIVYPEEILPSCP